MDKAQAAAAMAGIREIFVFGEADGATPFASLLQSDGKVPDVMIAPDDVVLALFQWYHRFAQRGDAHPSQSCRQYCATGRHAQRYVYCAQTMCCMGILPFITSMA
ncbi:MAG: hypothetical protein R2867_08940 [Caldilineaceae bacterium]